MRCEGRSANWRAVRFTGEVHRPYPSWDERGKLLRKLDYFIFTQVCDIVLAALLYAIIKGWKAGEQAVEGKERRPYLIAMIVAHIQLLLGLGLYFMGENGLTALNSLFDTGASLFSSLGFFGIIHFVLMVTAITLITKAHSLAKKMQRIASCSLDAFRLLIVL